MKCGALAAALGFAVVSALWPRLPEELTWPVKWAILVPFGVLLRWTGLWTRFMFRDIDGWLYAAEHAVRVPLVPDFQARPGDVIIATWPRSGTHFTMIMLADIMQRGAGTFDDIHKLSYCLEAPACLNPFDEAPPTEPLPRRIIATHINGETVPYSDKATYIVVMRDPVACFRSIARIFPTFSGPLSPSERDLYLFYARLRKGWAEWTLTWWKRKSSNPFNVHFFYYSEMVNDLAGNVKRLVDIMDWSLNQAEIDAVVKRSSFEHARTNDRTGKIMARPFSPPQKILTGFIHERGESPVSGEYELAVRKDLRKRLGEDAGNEIWPHLGLGDSSF